MGDGASVSDSLDGILTTGMHGDGLAPPGRARRAGAASRKPERAGERASGKDEGSSCRRLSSAVCASARDGALAIGTAASVGCRGQAVGGTGNSASEKQGVVAAEGEEERSCSENP